MNKEGRTTARLVGGYLNFSIEVPHRQYRYVVAVDLFPPMEDGVAWLRFGHAYRMVETPTGSERRRVTKRTSTTIKLLAYAWLENHPHKFTILPVTEFRVRRREDV